MEPDGSPSLEKRTTELLTARPIHDMRELDLPPREHFATDNRGYFDGQERLKRRERLDRRRERREARRRWLLRTVPGILVLVGVSGVLVVAAVLLFRWLR